MNYRGIVYLSVAQHESDLPQSFDSPRELLRPYVDATLDLISRTQDSRPEVLFRLFFTRSSTRFRQEDVTDLSDNRILYTQPLPAHCALNGDTAAREAESLFRDALKLLSRDDIDSFWPPLQDMDDEVYEE